MPAREMENLLPFSFFKAVESTHFDNLAAFERIRDRTPKELHLFLDIKSGLVAKQIIKRFPELSDAAQMWKAQLSDCDLFPSVDSECLDTWTCGGDEHCTCRILDGFGDNLLARVDGYLAEFSPHKSAELLANSECEEWLKLGEEVFGWCCGPLPMRV